MRLSEIRNKQVVNMQDGCSIGYPSDIVLKMPEGCIDVIVVEANIWKRWFPFLWGGNETLVPMCDIVHIGADVILVKVGHRSTQGTA